MNCYKTHVPRISSEFMTYPLKVFPALGKFVLATIQQQFHTVPAILDDWDKYGSEAESCWGMKRDGYQFLSDPETFVPVALELHSAMQRNDRETAIDTLVAIPGINVVKAAFIAQMVGLETACLDTQNIKRLGIENVRAFHITKTNTAKTRLAKIRAYLTLCDELGSSEYFWNTWCAQIADIYPSHFTLDLDVSVQHVKEILGRIGDIDNAEDVPF